MTDEEKSIVGDFIAKAIKSAREQVPKKANVMDKVNLGVTAMAFLVGPVCWLLVSQKIDLRVGDVVSTAKDTYVDKSTFGAAVVDINNKFGQQEAHLDSVDVRENSDKSSIDIKIQSLQDAVGKRALANSATNHLIDP